MKFPKIGDINSKFPNMLKIFHKRISVPTQLSCIPIKSFYFSISHNYAFHGAAQNTMEGLPNQGSLGGFEMGVPNIQSPMGTDYQASLDTEESQESVEEEGYEI